MKNLASVKTAIFIGVTGWLLVSRDPMIGLAGVFLTFLISRVAVEVFGRLARDPADGDHHPVDLDKAEQVSK